MRLIGAALAAPTGTRNRLIVRSAVALRLAVASEVLAAWLLKPSAGVRAWLPIEVLAVRDLAVVWLERGVSAELRSAIRHADRGLHCSMTKEPTMTVMIGVDPHKGSHTALAIDDGENQLAVLRVRSGPKQLERLLAWADGFPARTWAIENATGLGYLLAQQLVAAGEQVLDVQPKQAARVRLLDTESTDKNDPMMHSSSAWSPTRAEPTQRGRKRAREGNRRSHSRRTA
jgi:hypothetical protein